MASNSDRVRMVLGFLNGARSPEEIVERVQDDPEFESASKRAYGVRPGLAQRMLDTRNDLPKQEFESLAQVEAVRGLGDDTLHDIFKSVSGGPPPPSGDPSRKAPLSDLILAAELLRRSDKPGGGGGAGAAARGGQSGAGIGRASGSAARVGDSLGGMATNGSSESDASGEAGEDQGSPDDAGQEEEHTAKYGKGAWRIWLPPAAMLAVGFAVGWILRGKPTGGGSGPSVVQLDPSFYSTLDSLVNRTESSNDSALILLAAALDNWPPPVLMTGVSNSRDADVPLTFGHTIEMVRVDDTIEAQCLMEGVTVKRESRPVSSIEPSR